MSEEAKQAAQETPNAAEVPTPVVDNGNQQSNEDAFYGAKKEGESDKGAQDAAATPPDSTEKPAETSEKDPPKDPAEKPGEAKKDEPAPIVLKLPEGTSLDQTDLDEVSSFAKANGLNQAQAQAMLEREAAISKQLAADEPARQQEIIKENTSKWLEAAKADKDIGGEKFGQSAESAKRVVDRFASPAMKEIFNKSGFGNHPEVLRMFAKIGKAMAPDTLESGKIHGSGEQPLEDVFYGGSKK